MRHQPKKVLTNYLFYFLAILILPIIILTVGWLTREWHEQTNDLSSAQEQTLSTVTDNLNETLSHMIVTTNQMALDNVFSEQHASTNDFVDTSNILNAIDRYSLSNQLILKTFVYLNSSPAQLYSSDGTYDVEPTLYKYGLVHAFNSSEKQSEPQSYLISRSTEPKLLYHAAQNQIADQLTFAVPMIPTPGTPPKGVVFYTLNVPEIRQQLSEASTVPHQSLVLMTGDGSITAGQQPLAPSLVRANKVSEWKRIANQRNLEVATGQGSGDLFTIVSLVTKPSPMLSLLTFIKGYSWLFAVVLVAGGSLIWLLGRRQYADLHRLSTIIMEPKNETYNTVQSGSELARLEDNLTAYVAAHQAALVRERIKLPLVRNQVLEMIISGRTNDAVAVQRLLRLGQVTFYQPYFVIGVLSDVATLDEQDLPSPVQGTGYSAYFVHRSMQSQMLVLLNYGPTVAWRRILEQARTEIVIDPTTPMFAGRSVTHVSEIRNSFIEALVAQMTNEVQPGEMVSLYKERNQRNDSPSFDIYNELKLSNSLRQGNRHMAEEAFEALFDGAVQKYDPETMVNLPISNIISEVLKADFQKHHEVNDGLAKQLFNADSFTTIHSLLLTAIQEITQPVPAASDRKVALHDFIVANASSPTLSLTDIAERFDISIPYASHYVKEVTGKTFTSFVQNVRMARVCAALEETNDPIRDIVLANGYYDVANFTRKFKQLNGVTPGQYRRLHQETQA